ncbi:MAG: hypothetical protein ACLQLG_09435 [Thermoguttaceae bacterium]
MAYQQVILHVGTGRTGTTTIQSFLRRNREHFRRDGFLAVTPDGLALYPHEDGFWEEEHLKCGLQELNRRSEEQGTPGVVWSHESLSAYIFVKNANCVQLLRDWLPAANYRIVIYLRRQDHYLRSAYLQWGVKDKHIKGRPYGGRVLGFDDWLVRMVGDNFQDLRGGDVDYHALVKPWGEVFGNENVVVRVFEKEQFHQHDLLRDFCRAARLPQAGYDFELPRENVSYSMELHDMLGMYNSVFAEPHVARPMYAFLEALGKDPFFARQFFSPFAIPATRRIEILQRCEESNRKVAREFLGRADGVLFREPWPSPDEPFQPYGGLTTEKLVPILLHILQKQDERIGELESKAAISRQSSEEDRILFERIRSPSRQESEVTLGQAPSNGARRLTMRRVARRVVGWLTSQRS